MSSVAIKRASTFSDKAKKGLVAGQELSENGIIYRKRTDGYGTWRYDFTESGKRYKGVIGSDRDGITLSQAREILSEIRARVITDRISGKTGRSTYSKLLFKEVASDFIKWGETYYKEHRHNIGRMNRYLIPTFGNIQLCEITTAMIENFRAELVTQGLGANTISRITSLLSCTFKYAQKSDSFIDNPTDRISKTKLQKNEVIPFTKSETDALLNTGCVSYTTITRGLHKGNKVINEYKTAELSVLTGLALYAGLRASEALGLEWSSVNFDRKVISISQVAIEGKLRLSTKSSKVRQVPISKSLLPLLIALKDFHDEHGRQSGLVLSRDGVTPYNQVQAMFSRIRKQAGLDKGQGYHVLRHTFATRAAQNNIDIPTLQKLLGHSNITVTMRYIHSTDAHMEASMVKLD